MKNILLLVSFITLFNFSFSQEKSGDIEVYLNNIVENLPGSSGDDFQVPTTTDINTWGNLLNNLFANQLENARNLADLLNYQITEYHDNELDKDFYIIEEKQTQSKYWGTYIFSINPLRSKLILQAPHPKYDSNTGYQAIYCFKRTQAQALFISGTHRCNHSQLSSCSGTSSSCGELSAYRVSDNAHNTNSIFQKTTEKAVANYSNSVFVQLHGFSKSETDPYVIMSNGTRITPATDYASIIKDNLLVADPSLTFKIANIDTDWNRLIAFTNTQGRLINNSSNPCTQNATNSDGKFVHIEQERTKLRKNEAGWSKMSSALYASFPEDPTTNVTSLTNNNKIKIYPNPNNGNFNIQIEKKANIFIYNISGNLVFSSTSNKPLQTIDLKNQDSGVYLVKIIYQNKICYEKISIIK